MTAVNITSNLSKREKIRRNPFSRRNRRAKSLRNEKVKVLSAISPVDPAAIVRGQYDGYRDEEGVDPSSNVETFVALRAEIDSWRWAGVPFYIRAGKRLATTATEFLIEFKQPPRLFFARSETECPIPSRIR